MNEDLYAVALKSALTEIESICPDIKTSFILMDHDTVTAKDDQAADTHLENAVRSFRDLAEKTQSVGGLDGLLIDAENGEIYASKINNIYFIAALSRQTDLTYLRTITRVVLPTILKVLDSMSTDAVSPSPLKPPPSFTSITPFESAPSKTLVEKEATEEPLEIEPSLTTEPPEVLEEEKETDVEFQLTKETAQLPSQQLIVDRFGGLMVRSDTVQIDLGILQRWNSSLNVKEIQEVDVETFSGKTARCKAKIITDQKLEGRGLIRIPEKMCDTLEVKRGELVKVKPVLPESE